MNMRHVKEKRKMERSRIGKRRSRDITRQFGQIANSPWYFSLKGSARKQSALPTVLKYCKSMCSFTRCSNQEQKYDRKYEPWGSGFFLGFFFSLQAMVIDQVAAFSLISSSLLGLP